MAAGGEHLVTYHRELADEQWELAIEAEQEGTVKDAIRACRDAIDHLERAEELAREFRPAEAEDVVERRERIQLAVAGLRENVPADAGTTPDPKQASAGEMVNGDSPTERGAELELLDIDTHQEITLETTFTEGETEGGVGQETEEGVASETEGEPISPEDETEEEISDVPIMDALGESDPDPT